MLFASLSEGLGIMSLVLVVQVMLESDVSQAPKLVQTIFEFLSRTGMNPSFVNLLLAMGGLILIKTVLLILAETYAVRVNTRIASDFRLELIDNIAKANWNFFTSHRLGRLTNSLHEEVTQAAGIYLVLCRSASHISNLLIYVLAAAALSWTLSLTALVASLLLLRMMRTFVEMSGKAGSRQMTANKEMMSIFSEGLIGMKMLKVMGLEHRLVMMLRREVSSLMKAHFYVGFAKIMTKHFREPFLLLLITAATLVLVQVKGSINGIDISVFVGMVVIFQRAINGAGHLQQQYQNLVSKEPFLVSLQDAIYSATDSLEELRDSSGSILAGPVDVRNLHVTYDRDREVLRGINLSLRPGSLTVLLGESGSGKTTLADTICGLYQPTEGQILVGGEPLDRNNIFAWRQQIGYVEQEPFLFFDSIKNNIFIEGVPSDKKFLNSVLQKSGCDRFVASMPLGLDTVVGERGAQLSGGQRQRVAIARALARSPKFLVLDEATNGLDENTEQEILKTLTSLKDETIMLFLTHRKQVLVVADQVLELKDGLIVGS